MAVIGIVGFINSGKGTVGTLLENHYGFKTESFAKPLKDAAAAIFGWNRVMLEGADDYSRQWREQIDPRWAAALNRPDFSPRLALQLMGTEAGRQVFGESLWTTSCILRCQGQGTGQGRGAIENYVITDCRFRNEIKAIKDVNGIVIRVKRGPEPDWYEHAAWGPPVASNTKLTAELWEGMKYKHLIEYMAHNPLHQSEWDWAGADFDYVIENDGTIADLQTKLYDILVDLKLTHKPFRPSIYVPSEG